jgi:hypothetical protein
MNLSCNVRNVMEATVAALIGDAFKRAAAEKMKKVVMEFDFNIATYWKK